MSSAPTGRAGARDRRSRRATPAPRAAASAASGDGSLAALTVAAFRNQLLATVIKEGANLKVGNCTANGVIRDPAFRPILTASVADPSAMLDADQVRLLQQNVLKIATSCAKSPLG